MTRITFPVTGMSCAACAGAVQRRLAATDGVSEAAVNLATNKATVEWSGGAPDLKALTAAVRAAGYDVGRDVLSIAIPGLRFVPSTERLERAIAAVPGVEAVTANPAAESLRVTYVPGFTSVESLEQAVAECGLETGPIAAADPLARDEALSRAEQRDLTWKFAVSALATLVTMLGSMPLMGGGAGHSVRSHDLLARLLEPADAALRGAMPWLYAMRPATLKLVLLAASVPVVFWAARRIYVAAWRGIRHRAAD
ncbi:MAG TPA: cation transporter, partial [Gemmatimonadales bacterium]|nr:cation transporter [Gemmatimonadales bacterium]